MATGDILSFTIDSSGWFATVKVEGVGVGGAYDFGFGAKNDPTNAKITLNLTSQGYNATPTLGIIARTVYGVPCVQPDLGAMRKVYPNDADPNETVSGSDVDIVIALSEYIYDPDVSVTVDFLSGWYDDGTASNSVTDLAVTNNSSISYQVPVGNWAYPGFSKVIEDFYVEVTAFHRFDIAAVVISATDGSTSVSEVLTDLVISPHDDYNSVLVYRSLIDVSGFNDGIITVDFAIYPKVGNALSLLESDDAVNTFPTPHYTSQKYRLDTGLNHGVTVVDPTSGNDGTGVVYNTEAAAEAGDAYQTIAAAVTAIQAYNNTNASHNDAGGGTLLFTEDTAVLNTGNGGTMTEWLLFKPISTASRANTIIQTDTSTSSIPNMTRLQGVTCAGGGFYRGFDTAKLWYDTVDMQQTGILSIYQTPYSVASHCIGNFPNEFKVFGANETAWGILRGNEFTSNNDAITYTTLGNRNVNLIEVNNVQNPVQKNVVYAFNTLNHSTDTVQIQQGVTHNIDGLAIVQNELIRYGTQIQAMILISADNSTTTSNNVIMWHNSLVGARINAGYNDIASGGPYAQLQWSIVNNIWSNFNNKDDTFNNNADAIGGWPVGYEVGSNGNFYRTTATQEWLGEFQGVGANQGTFSTPLEPLYEVDNSADGANTSGGDYHLQDASPARGLIQRQVLPFDLDGRSRRSDGSVGALEYYAIATPDDLILSAIILEQTKATPTIIANNLVLSAIILQSPIVSAVVSPDNLILSAIILEQTSIGGTISPDDLILSSIILESPSVSGIISPDNLVLSSIILEQATVIPAVIPENLVLSSIILGQTKQSGEIEGPISISISLSKSNISMNLDKSDISISLKKSNISMELNT